MIRRYLARRKMRWAVRQRIKAISELVAYGGLSIQVAQEMLAETRLDAPP